MVPGSEWRSRAMKRKKILIGAMVAAEVSVMSCNEMGRKSGLRRSSSRWEKGKMTHNKAPHR
jgi:hypothetical protein